MTKTISFLFAIAVVSQLSVAQASRKLPPAKSVNCNATIKANADDAVAVALICSDYTDGLLREDQLHAKHLNVIRQYCQAESYNSVYGGHSEWIVTYRNHMLSAAELKRALEDQTIALRTAALSAMDGTCPYWD